MQHLSRLFNLGHHMAQTLSTSRLGCLKQHMMACTHLTYDNNTVTTQQPASSYVQFPKHILSTTQA
jgi:hypothetical protein